MNGELNDLIKEAMQQLKGFGFLEGTLKSYEARAFYPVLKLYSTKRFTKFQRGHLQELKNDFQRQYADSLISKVSLNWGLRGINILSEIFQTGYFE